MLMVFWDVLIVLAQFFFYLGFSNFVSCRMFLASPLSYFFPKQTLSGFILFSMIT